MAVDVGGGVCLLRQLNVNDTEPCAAEIPGWFME